MIFFEVIKMASTTKPKENKTAKRLRITMAVLYFIEVLLTTFPFLRGVTEEGDFKQLTAFEIAVQPAGYPTSEDVQLAIIFAVFIVLPMVAFFFCILDRKSNVKNFVSALCCIVCAVLIVFFIGPAKIAIGSVIALLLYILILFLTTMSFFASVKRDE